MLHPAFGMVYIIRTNAQEDLSDWWSVRSKLYQGLLNLLDFGATFRLYSLLYSLIYSLVYFLCSLLYFLSYSLVYSLLYFLLYSLCSLLYFLSYSLHNPCSYSKSGYTHLVTANYSPLLRLNCTVTDGLCRTQLPLLFSGVNGALCGYTPSVTMSPTCCRLRHANVIVYTMSRI